jgi:hypothetical protein
MKLKTKKMLAGLGAGAAVVTSLTAGTAQPASAADVGRQIYTSDPYPKCDFNYGGGGSGGRRTMQPGQNTRDFGWNDADGVFVGEGYYLVYTLPNGQTGRFDGRGSGVGNAVNNARLVKLSPPIDAGISTITVFIGRD